MRRTSHPRRELGRIPNKDHGGAPSYIRMSAPSPHDSNPHVANAASSKFVQRFAPRAHAQAPARRAIWKCVVER